MAYSDEQIRHTAAYFVRTLKKKSRPLNEEEAAGIERDLIALLRDYVHRSPKNESKFVIDPNDSDDELFKDFFKLLKSNDFVYPMTDRYVLRREGDSKVIQGYNATYIYRPLKSSEKKYNDDFDMDLLAEFQDLSLGEEDSAIDFDENDDEPHQRVLRNYEVTFARPIEDRLQTFQEMVFGNDVPDATYNYKEITADRRIDWQRREDEMVHENLIDAREQFLREEAAKKAKAAEEEASEALIREQELERISSYRKQRGERNVKARSHNDSQRSLYHHARAKKRDENREESKLRKLDGAQASDEPAVRFENAHPKTDFKPSHPFKSQQEVHHHHQKLPTKPQTKVKGSKKKTSAERPLETVLKRSEPAASVIPHHVPFVLLKVEARPVDPSGWMMKASTYLANFQAQRARERETTRGVQENHNPFSSLFRLGSKNNQ